MAFYPSYQYPQVPPFQPLAQLIPGHHQQAQINNGLVPYAPTAMQPPPQPQAFFDPGASPSGGQRLDLDHRASWNGPHITTYQQVQFPSFPQTPQAPPSPQYPMMQLPPQVIAPSIAAAPPPPPTMVYAPYPVQAQAQPQHHHFYLQLPPSPQPQLPPQPLPQPELPLPQPDQPLPRQPSPQSPESDRHHSRSRRHHRRHSHSGPVNVTPYLWERAQPPLAQRAWNTFTGHPELNVPKMTGRLVPALPPNTTLQLPYNYWTH